MPETRPELLLHERYDRNGESERVRLVRAEGGLDIWVGETELPLPDGALAAVFVRYGRPLDPEIGLENERFALGDGGHLVRLRHRARYDVIARDFLVWLPPSGEALVELATSVAAALVHLARANARMARAE